MREYQLIKRVSVSVKPLLNDQNKRDRLLSHVNSSGLFDAMENTVHIDEKWFYMTKVNRRYYLTRDEEHPHNEVKSKRFITKVMFMAAVARPQYLPSGECYFNGQIGIWPFTYQCPAQKSSKNRPKGTLETKTIESIGKREIKQMLMDKVIPAIQDRMPPHMKNDLVYMQQDNAKPHSSQSEFLSQCTSNGWTMEFKKQPANGPDLNVLDLGFFNAIQSI